ncbi:hypothetical protein M404DRAFT_998698 [Pisolithus tinctorius Marx 270]|uniref:Uncharacterized protein n=1 Tax=Pisolithus tinctorius Marx 270 TaxID=870435 RepID=A0A0C3JBV9_PISTI|nr:hypothetical protein M404DRAFT_998698 [Pisolithus tinctorius Marx 270]
MERLRTLVTHLVSSGGLRKGRCELRWNLSLGWTFVTRVHYRSRRLHVSNVVDLHNRTRGESYGDPLFQ